MLNRSTYITIRIAGYIASSCALQKGLITRPYILSLSFFNGPEERIYLYIYEAAAGQVAGGEKKRLTAMAHEFFIFSSFVQWIALPTFPFLLYDRSVIRTNISFDICCLRNFMTGADRRAGILAFLHFRNIYISGKRMYNYIQQSRDLYNYTFDTNYYYTKHFGYKESVKDNTVKRYKIRNETIYRAHYIQT